MKPGPAQRRDVVIQSLARQGVGEPVAVSDGGRTALRVGRLGHDQPSLEGLLERRHELFLVEPADALKHRRVEVSADHRGRAKPICGGVTQAYKALGDHPLEVFRQPEASQLGRPRLANGHPRLVEPADDLQNEQRVSLGLCVQCTRQCQ